MQTKHSFGVQSKQTANTHLGATPLGEEPKGLVSCSENTKTFFILPVQGLSEHVIYQPFWKFFAHILLMSELMHHQFKSITSHTCSFSSGKGSSSGEVRNNLLRRDWVKHTAIYLHIFQPQEHKLPMQHLLGPPTVTEWARGEMQGMSSGTEAQPRQGSNFLNVC